MNEEVLILTEARTMALINGAVNELAVSDANRAIPVVNLLGAGGLAVPAIEGAGCGLQVYVAPVEMRRGSDSAMEGATRDIHVRLELVAKLREAIAAGRYSVAAGDVAEKLMGAMLRRGCRQA